MAKAESAGLLMYSLVPELRVLLAHPGGPFFANKDNASWSIPKGLIERDEHRLQAAIREFVEETGYRMPANPNYLPLGHVQLKHKIVHAWAFEGDWEPGRQPESNSFTIEWPPRSGRKQSFPEIDRAEFFTVAAAREKINPGQMPFLDRLHDCLRDS